MMRARILPHDQGTTAAEYALIVSLIAVVILAAVIFFGQGVTSLFDTTASSVDSAVLGG